MRTAIYIIAFIILSVGIAFTIRTTDMENVLDKKKDKKEKKKMLGDNLKLNYKNLFNFFF